MEIDTHLLKDLAIANVLAGGRQWKLAVREGERGKYAVALERWDHDTMKFVPVYKEIYEHEGD